MALLVVIDGVSSSGRTSLVKEFVAAGIGTAFQSYHIDEFTRQLPPETWRRCAGSDSGWAEIGIAFNEFLVERAKLHDFIIADAFYKLSQAREHLFSKFRRPQLFYVQLYCDLQILELRETHRGDRRIGLARSQFDHIYSFTEYDLKIDSTHRSIKDCANLLSSAIFHRGLS